MVSRERIESLDDRLHEVESNLIDWALKPSGGNKSRAAELLHVKRSTLGDRIARWGMVSGVPEHRRPSPAASRTIAAPDVSVGAHRLPLAYAEPG